MRKFFLCLLALLCLSLPAFAGNRVVRTFVRQGNFGQVQVTQFSNGATVVEPLNGVFLNTGSFIQVGNGVTFSSTNVFQPSNVAVFRFGRRATVVTVP